LNEIKGSGVKAGLKGRKKKKKERQRASKIIRRRKREIHPTHQPQQEGGREGWVSDQRSSVGKRNRRCRE